MRNKNLSEIVNIFQTLKLEDKEVFELEVLEIDIENIGYKSFVDLASIFFMKLLTPKQLDETTTLLRFQKLQMNSSFHLDNKTTEKYGKKSKFFKINKLSKFSFYYYYKQALLSINLKSKKSILNLGINKGDEFKVIEEILTTDEFNSKKIIGIDHSSSAIEYASKQFSSPNINFFCHDINDLNELNLDKSELLISIGTLQSTNLNFNQTFMDIYQNHVAKGGAIILGFPNCRWIDGEMIYGAKTKNYKDPEMSLVLKDIHFCKKYLQQKKYRVKIIGKDYLFLVATPIG